MVLGDITLKCGGEAIDKAIVRSSAQMENPLLTVRVGESSLHNGCLERIKYLRKLDDGTMLSHGMCAFGEFIGLVLGHTGPFQSLTLDGASAVLVVNKKKRSPAELVFALHFRVCD